MGRLSKIERNVISEEIYNTVSLPIEEDNQKKIENYPLPSLLNKAISVFKKRQDKIDALEEEQNAQIEWWKLNSAEELDGYDVRYGHNSPMRNPSKVRSYLAKKNLMLKVAPSIEAIEKKIILSRVNDVQELIKSISEELK